MSWILKDGDICFAEEELGHFRQEVQHGGNWEATVRLGAGGLWFPYRGSGCPPASGIRTT